MSSLPLELGLVQTTSDQHHHQSEEVIVAEIADLSLTELPLSSSSSSSSNHNLLQHFSHDHPLILFQVVVKEKEEEEEEEGNNNIDVQLTTTTSTVTVGGLGQENNSVVCPGCRDDPVVVFSESDHGPIYRCSSTTAGCSDKECKFFLHKSCAELPLKIVSSLHPDHLLNLLPHSRTLYCDICRGQILGFSYSCRPCNFDLHIKCASLHKIEPQSHPHQDHSFIFHKLATFTCDACGKDEVSKKLSFLCTTCQFQVHTYKLCSSSSYPLTLKIIRHSHKLILTYSYELDFDFSHKSCKICNKKMNSVFCVYYCSACAYIAHVRCATLEHLRDDYFEDQVVAEECDDLATELIQCGEGEDQKATEQRQLLEHFSHPHCLILSNDEPKIDQLCDGCLWPVSVPFYTCPTDQCNFSLHKQCAELRGKIRHPLHRHPLTLYAEHPMYPVFRCLGCHILCNGFTYNCDECNKFCICVGCSLFSDTLSHEGHQCPLNIIYSDKDKTKCSTCDLNCSTKFICEECNFNLCLRCASLPKATMHKCPKPDWGIRPIKLTYYSDEYETGEYYCDICEERRNQDHWFYYCEACDYSCHPDCILGKNLIKFGKTYNYGSYHHHPLTIVKNVKGRTTGANCDDSCKNSLLLVCPECDICTHLINNCPEFWRI